MFKTERFTGNKFYYFCKYFEFKKQVARGIAKHDTSC